MHTKRNIGGQFRSEVPPGTTMRQVLSMMVSDDAPGDGPADLFGVEASNRRGHRIDACPSLEDYDNSVLSTQYPVRISRRP